jgi:hypothetical protein
MLNPTDKKKRAVVHGIPGEGARARGVSTAVLPLLAAVFLFGFLTGIIIPVAAATPMVFALAGIFVLVLWLAYDFFQGVASYFKGARGEEIVAVWLAAGLDCGYHIFHDIEKNGVVPIDHLVIGPTGIFVIETKFWSGRVACTDGELKVDGQCPSRSPIAQVKDESFSLTAYLNVKTGVEFVVTPIVCFAGGTYVSASVSCFDQIDGVAICNVDDLTELIHAGKNPVTALDIEQLVKLMEFRT